MAGNLFEQVGLIDVRMSDWPLLLLAKWVSAAVLYSVVRERDHKFSSFRTLHHYR